MVNSGWLCGCVFMLAGAAMAQTSATATYKTEMMESMEKMHHVMGADRLSGDADKDFLIMMIPHHQGAVDMARVELKYGKDPQVKEMARKIIAAQEIEIDQMNKHLARLGGETTSSKTNMMHGNSMKMDNMDHDGMNQP